MEFKDRLKLLRESRGLTQTELATKLNELNVYNMNKEDYKISTQTISYWENGREPKFDMIWRLSRFFQVPTDYLMGKTDYINEFEFYLEKRTELITKESIDSLLEEFPDEIQSKLYKIYTLYLENVPTKVNAFNNPVLKEVNFYSTMYKFVLFSEVIQILKEMAYSIREVNLSDFEGLNSEMISIEYNEKKMETEKKLNEVLNKLYKYNLFNMNYYRDIEYNELEAEKVDKSELENLKQLFYDEIESYES